jgi:hypothetical protein
VDFANDKRSTLKDKFELLINYAMAHTDIARDNIERQVAEDTRVQQQQQMAMPVEQGTNPGVPAGMSKAMNMAEMAT